MGIWIQLLIFHSCFCNCTTKCSFHFFFHYKCSYIEIDTLCSLLLLFFNFLKKKTLIVYRKLWTKNFKYILTYTISCSHRTENYSTASIILFGKSFSFSLNQSNQSDTKTNQKNAQPSQQIWYLGKDKKFNFYFLYIWISRLVNLSFRFLSLILVSSSPTAWSFSGDFHKDRGSRRAPLSRRVSWALYWGKCTLGKEETRESNSYPNCCLQVKSKD